ncbi:hypothetical protein [Xanthomonas hortorum]|uniref:hypothetical protein n=1 Tax=Xanthomonas hortorum TaxID=56454 RepID=UPI001594519A|nr:hypothetical protein [Xanthomonas hortorum]NHF68436.1 hypothetical protein [Xanthomonas hortorum]
MDDKLVARYQKYASSEGALAVLFVNRYFDQAIGHRVDPEDFRRHGKSPDPLHFRLVTGGLYRRTVVPKYPPKTDYTLNPVFNERGYLAVIRALTWEAAYHDIEKQKRGKAPFLNFEVAGISHDRSRGSTGFFRDDALLQIKALALNLQDLTDLLWDSASARVAA